MAVARATRQLLPLVPEVEEGILRCSQPEARGVALSGIPSAASLILLLPRRCGDDAGAQAGWRQRSLAGSAGGARTRFRRRLCGGCQRRLDPMTPLLPRSLKHLFDLIWMRTCAIRLRRLRVWRGSPLALWRPPAVCHASRAGTAPVGRAIGAWLGARRGLQGTSETRGADLVVGAPILHLGAVAAWSAASDVSARPTQALRYHLSAATVRRRPLFRKRVPPVQSAAL